MSIDKEVIILVAEHIWKRIPGDPVFNLHWISVFYHESCIRLEVAELG